MNRLGGTIRIAHYHLDPGARDEHFPRFPAALRGRSL
jgi:hypothetical protein